MHTLLITLVVQALQIAPNHCLEFDILKKDEKVLRNLKPHFAEGDFYFTVSDGDYLTKVCLKVKR